MRCEHKIIKLNGYNINFNTEEYNSVYELNKVINSRKVTDKWQGKENKHIDPTWCGISSKEEAYKLLVNGWKDKVKAVSTLSNKVEGNDEEKRNKRVNSVVGYTPIIPLALKGVPNCMVDTESKKIKSKVLKIIYNLGLTCDYSSEDILNCGLKFINAIYDLEHSGYRCEILGLQMFCSKDNKTIDGFMIHLKDANQPLDLQRLMFPLLHPAMFRVVGFDWQDRFPKGIFMSGRGRSITVFCDDEAKIRQDMKKIFGDNTRYFDTPMIFKATRAGNENFVKNTLKEG